MLLSDAMRAAGLVTVAALLAFLPAGANDTAVTLGAGGLVPAKSLAIAMESEELEISCRQIKVRYVFRNTTTRDVDVAVAFPLPEIDGGDVANAMMNIPSKDPMNFMDFEVSIGGRKVKPRVEIRAFSGDGEITSRLRSVGLPLSALDADGVNAAMKRLDSRVRAELESNGWIDCGLTKGKCWPYWKTRIQFYWTQHFPAGKKIEVQHAYRPVIGGSYIVQEDDGSGSVGRFCGRRDAVERIREVKALHPMRKASDTALVERRIQYVLMTANNWSGPIRSFRLLVRTDSADDIVTSCIPGLTRTGPTTYELARENFRPDADLDLLILQAAK